MPKEGALKSALDEFTKLSRKKAEGESEEILTKRQAKAIQYIDEYCMLLGLTLMASERVAEDELGYNALLNRIEQYNQNHPSHQVKAHRLEDIKVLNFHADLKVKHPASNTLSALEKRIQNACSILKRNAVGNYDIKQLDKLATQTFNLAKIVLMDKAKDRLKGCKKQLQALEKKLSHLGFEGKGQAMFGSDTTYFQKLSYLVCAGLRAVFNFINTILTLGFHKDRNIIAEKTLGRSFFITMPKTQIEAEQITAQLNNLKTISKEIDEAMTQEEPSARPKRV